MGNGSVRYNHPTPNPLPASEEGAIIYLITVHTAINWGLETGMKNILALLLFPLSQS
jgi:hypothetical protein